MSVEANKRLLRAVVERIVNAREWGLADELFAADVVDHSAPPGLPPGLEGVRQTFALLARAFPDWRGTIEQLVAEGDRAAAWVRFQGTHRGDFFGVPPSGRAVAWDALHLVRVANGTIVEHWGSEDNLGLLTPLGALPERA